MEGNFKVNVISQGWIRLNRVKDCMMWVNQKMIPLAGSGLSHQVQQYMQMCTLCVADYQKTPEIKTFVFEKRISSRTWNISSQITIEIWREVQLWISGNVAKFTEHFKMGISAELNYSFCSQAWTTWWMFIHSSLTVKHHPAVCWIHYVLHIIFSIFCVILFSYNTVDKNHIFFNRI